MFNPFPAFSDLKKCKYDGSMNSQKKKTNNQSQIVRLSGIISFYFNVMVVLLTGFCVVMYFFRCRLELSFHVSLVRYGSGLLHIVCLLAERTMQNISQTALSWYILQIPQITNFYIWEHHLIKDQLMIESKIGELTQGKLVYCHISLSCRYQSSLCTV